MKSRCHKKGFTLIELSIVIVLGIAISAFLMSLFNQQLLFLKIFKTQNFLIDEAPMINLQVNRLVSKAERFRLHASTTEALAGTNARLTASPVLVMNYREPDGSMRATILSYENDVTLGKKVLKYYIVPKVGALGAAQWTVTSRPTDGTINGVMADGVSFAVNNGVLQMTLRGPAGEDVTYSATVQSSGAINRSGTITQ